MRHRTRPLALAATAAALALTAGACGSSSSTKSATPATTAPASTNVSNVTLNIGDQAGTGAQALLDASGLISKLPFKASWHDFTSGPPILQAMASGSVDFGQVGNAPPAFSAAGNANIAIVGALANGPNDAAILVPKGSSVQTVADLKGKKVAVAQGTSGNYNLLAVLDHEKLTASAVNADYLQPAPGLAAFTSGSVDAWDIWSPYAEEVEVEKGAKVVANASTYGNYSFNLASRSALNDPAKNAAVRDLLSLLNQARVWANTHPQQWAAAWGKSTGLPATVMSKAAVDSDETPVPIDQKVIGGEQTLADDFSKAGLIPQDPKMASFFYTGFNSLYSK